MRYGLAARGIEERTLLADEWDAALPAVLLRAYTWLEDYAAVDREVAAAQAMPSAHRTGQAGAGAGGPGARVVRGLPPRRGR